MAKLRSELSHQNSQGSEDPCQGPTGCPDAEHDPVLCVHCGRTASNGISCQGSCVADTGY
ncbi:MAG: hypothetical protein VKI39_04370 [Synechococcus sp.]|nr:hypothetical protein [Synechococcus sp.]